MAFGVLPLCCVAKRHRVFDGCHRIVSNSLQKISNISGTIGYQNIFPIFMICSKSYSVNISNIEDSSGRIALNIHEFYCQMANGVHRIYNYFFMLWETLVVCGNS